MSEHPIAEARRKIIDCLFLLNYRHAVFEDEIKNIMCCQEAGHYYDMTMLVARRHANQLLKGKSIREAVKMASLLTGEHPLTMYKALVAQSGTAHRLGTDQTG